MGIELTATPGASVASTHATERDKEERIDMHMATHTKQWTLEELHSLPDDGNKYELVRGELFVTPPPTDEHETVLARLSRILDPYVAAHGLGMVYHPRAVMRFEGSEVEPDLMVRQPHPNPREGWDTAPTPYLIVEVLSGSTRRRDQVQKRQLYLAAGVPEYWIVDTERAEVRVVRAGVDDDVASGQLVWAPAGAAEALLVNLESVFG
jgi:Uma2 family endonuclease